MVKTEEIIGSGSPQIAIVGAVHGDELVGPAVIKKLRKLKIRKGTLGLFIGHPIAIKKRKRFISQDLNRVFPGKKSGDMEEKRAYALIEKLAQFDVVIDIHGTNSEIDCLVIVTKFTPKIKKLLTLVPIQKVGLVPKKVFGGKELITHCRLGISLEYGPDKSTKQAGVVFRDVTKILKNLGVLVGKKSPMKQKILYRVYGTYPTPTGFIQEPSLKDFKHVKKGQRIGVAGNKNIMSTKNFYPLFLGKGKYPKILALMASQKNITL